MSALEIHDGIRAGGARVGIASVYRVLDGLDAAASSSASTSATASRASSPRAAASTTITSSATTAARWSRSRTQALEAAIVGVAGGRGYEVAAHDVVLRGACGDCR